MNLRNVFDKMEPHFHKGGRYENWYALYEAVDTIFYTPGTVTKSGSHVRDAINLKRIMILVWTTALRRSLLIWSVNTTSKLLTPVMLERLERAG